MEIPAIELHRLHSPYRCCGAAGSHRLRHPQTAATLRQPLLDRIDASDATTVVSTNFGCALHLREGLLDHVPAVEIIHPLVLLLRQLDESDDSR